MPIAHAQQVLKEFSVNKISDFSIRRLLAKIGTHYANDCEKDLTLTELQAAENNKSTRAEVGYIMPDGAFVPTKGENKREYVENKLAVMFTSDDIKETRQANGEVRIDIRLKRFAMHLGQGVEEFAANISKMAILKGVTWAKKLVFISDGAPYLKNICNKLYPQAIRILDWYHAVEHLCSTARKLFGENNAEQCAAWVEPLKQMMWEGKTSALLAELKSQAMAYKKDATPFWELINYYTAHTDAMNYAEYRAQGLQIGSGAIESAQNYIVANRLKLNGMMWTKRNARAILWLRCAFFEDRWDKLWRRISLPEALATP